MERKKIYCLLSISEYIWDAPPPLDCFVGWANKKCQLWHKTQKMWRAMWEEMGWKKRLKTAAGLIKYTDYHTMTCETPTWSASNHELWRWEKSQHSSKREKFLCLLARGNIRSCRGSKVEICPTFHFTPQPSPHATTKISAWIHSQGSSNRGQNRKNWPRWTL